jgi:hypothetical protein
MTSVLTKKQVKKYGPRKYKDEHGYEHTITAEVRYDDSCNNGHNTFAITGSDYSPRGGSSGGMLHDLIAEHFPELKPYLKWHLVSSDEPMHYVENSLYWAGKRGWCNGKPNDPPNLEHFRSTAVWADATQADMESVTKETLEARLPKIKEDFKAAVESLGLVY